MTLSPMKVGAALVAVVNPLIAFLLAVEWINWTDEQTAGVGIAANAGVALTVAVLAHFKVGTKTETVALAGGTSAFVTSMLGVFVLFNIVTLSADAIALVAPLIAVLFGLGTAVIAREAVTAPETPG